MGQILNWLQVAPKLFKGQLNELPSGSKRRFTYRSQNLPIDFNLLRKLAAGFYVQEGSSVFRIENGIPYVYVYASNIEPFDFTLWNLSADPTMTIGNINNWIASDGVANGTPFGVGWNANNIDITNGTLSLILNNTPSASYPYSSGEYKTTGSYGYGRFGTQMKVAKGSGVITSFYLYEGYYNDTNPYKGVNAIEFRINGQDTWKVTTGVSCLTEITFEEEGEIFSYEVLNTQYFVNVLSFDASLDFHLYEIERLATSLCWYVDGEKIREVNENIFPGSMRLIASFWCGDSSSAAQLGTFNYTDPIASQFKSLNFSPALIEEPTPNSPPVLTGTKTVLSNGTEDVLYIVSVADLLQGYTDADNDSLSVVDLIATNGTIVNNGNNTYTFTPGSNYSGNISLSYNIVDNKGGLISATQSFTLAPVNDAPALTEIVATLDEGTEDIAYVINVSDLLQGYTDVDEDILTVANLVATNGTVTNNGDGTYAFTPNSNYNGTIVLTYNVVDNEGGISIASKSFVVASVNDAPALTGTPVTLVSATEDTNYIISAANLLQGYTDADNEVLLVANLTSTNGTVTNNGNGTYTFIPNDNYNGSALLSYNITDSSGGLIAVTRSFNVAFVNDAPVLTGAKAVLSNAIENISYAINISDLLQGYTDVDGDTLSVANLVATNGTVINNGNNTYTFTPASNYNGAVTLTYDIVDSNGGTVAATQSFNVTPVNDPPVLTGTKATLANAIEDTNYIISVADLLQGYTDVDGDVLSVTNLTVSIGSVLNNGNGTYTFTAGSNYNGVVTLSYSVTDGSNFTTATQSFTVAPVNDAPALTGTPLVLGAGTEDNSYIISVADLLQGYTDADADVLSVANLTATNGSILNNGNGTYTFTPSSNYNGIVLLNYDVIDGNGGSVAVSYSFNITAVNDPPTLTAPVATLPNGMLNTNYIITVANLLQGYTDADGDVISVVNLAATNGTVVNNGNATYTFTPNNNYTGNVLLTYDIIDSQGGSVPVTQSFTVATPPSLTDISGTNYDFALGNASGDATSLWTLHPTAAAVIAMADTSGGYVARNTGGSFGYVIRTKTNLITGKEYLLTFRVKFSAGNTTHRFHVYTSRVLNQNGTITDNGSNSRISIHPSSNSTEWIEYSAVIVCQTGVIELRVEEYQNSAALFYLDYVRLKEIYPTTSLIDASDSNYNFATGAANSSSGTVGWYMSGSQGSIVTLSGADGGYVHRNAGQYSGILRRYTNLVAGKKYQFLCKAKTDAVTRSYRFTVNLSKAYDVNYNLVDNNAYPDITNVVTSTSWIEYSTIVTCQTGIIEIDFTDTQGTNIVAYLDYIKLFQLPDFISI